MCHDLGKHGMRLNTELNDALTDTMINDQILVLISIQDIQIELCLRGWNIGYKLTAKNRAKSDLISPSWALFIPL